MEDSLQPKEYKAYLDFTKSAEFSRLTEGENAVFPDFNAASVTDLQQLRDYIYEQIQEVRRQIKFSNFHSPRLSQIQIGQALHAREDYQKFVKENPIKVDTKPRAVGRNPYQPLPKIAGRIQC